MKKMYLLAVLFAAASMVACCGEQKKNADEACAEEACTECCAEEANVELNNEEE